MPNARKLLTESDVVKLLREAQGGLSQKEFAAVLGVAPSLLSQIFSGERSVNSAVLDHLGLELSERAFQKKGK